jgi:hypothetical protein
VLPNPREIVHGREVGCIHEESLHGLYHFNAAKVTLFPVHPLAKLSQSARSCLCPKYPST